MRDLKLASNRVLRLPCRRSSYAPTRRALLSFSPLLRLIHNRFMVGYSFGLGMVEASVTAVRAPQFYFLALIQKSKGLLMKRVILVLVCGLAFGAAAQAQRLPGNVIPESYDLTFTPDLVRAAFTGTETIHVRVEHAANSIVLNSAEIEFQDVTVSSGGAEQKASVTSDEKAEQTTFTVPKEIAAGPAAIHIHFTGTLNDK